MRNFVISALVTLLLVAVASPASADGSTGWKVYTYAPSDQTLSSKQADDGNAFTFTATPDTALFALQRPEGNTSLAGRTITATFSINAPAGTTFHYSGEGTPSNPCGTPATVRLYFSANGSMGSKKDWYSNFWWSRSAGSSQQLADGTYTITANVSPGSWSNWNGKLDTDRADGFAAAAADPALVGFSFGGGCFYENGVGATGGTATFTLVSFTIE
jgi:hypothetical protein